MGGKCDGGYAKHLPSGIHFLAYFKALRAVKKVSQNDVTDVTEDLPPMFPVYASDSSGNAPPPIRRPEKKSHGNAPSCHERTLTGLLALLHRESPVERLETAFTRR